MDSWVILSQASCEEGAETKWSTQKCEDIVQTVMKITDYLKHSGLKIRRQGGPGFSIRLRNALPLTKPSYCNFEYEGYFFKILIIIKEELHCGKYLKLARL